MSDGFQPNLDFKAANEAAEDGEALIIDLDGYEGPLHVLLALARSQKVDLMQISITRLDEQYLSFVKRARALRFSLAADYLVMAAWLAYLKSRLLLPRAEKGRGDEPPAEEVAANLAFRLAKLDAMRKASDALNIRPRLKRDVFVRGDPEQRAKRRRREMEERGGIVGMVREMKEGRRGGHSGRVGKQGCALLAGGDAAQRELVDHHRDHAVCTNENADGGVGGEGPDLRDAIHRRENARIALCPMEKGVITAAFITTN
jgi:hypothetical protein